MSGFDSFVAIDLETTGLDPGTCEVLELGAARFVDGKLAEKFSELVKPSIPIPSEITILTGITGEMVKSSPAIDLIFNKYQRFLEGSPWVVGHNVSFDLGFLKPHLTKPKYTLLEPRVMDTGVLARILFPRLSRYSLGSLVSHFQIARKKAHRALDDCRATAEVYLKLISHLASLDAKDRDSIGRLLFGTDSLDYFRRSLRGIQVVAAKISQAFSLTFQRKLKERFIRIMSSVNHRSRATRIIYRSMVAVENCLLHGGLISKRIPFYEYRPQQTAMAIKVAETLNRSEFLLCEAPTGVGKSLAYLLPVSWWASQNRERVVISTQTKSLQAQLFDAVSPPQIQDAVGYKFQAALLKGKGNYICLHNIISFCRRLRSH